MKKLLRLLRLLTRTCILIPLWFYTTLVLIFIFSANPEKWLPSQVIAHFQFECPVATIMITLAILGYITLTIVTWGTYILGR